MGNQNDLLGVFSMQPLMAFAIRKSILFIQEVKK